jgi:hypothetical protein
MTPDPYRASGGPADPESWNRYTYVEGDPVNYGDSSGLMRENCGAEWAYDASLEGPCSRGEGNGPFYDWGGKCRYAPSFGPSGAFCYVPFLAPDPPEPLATKQRSYFLVVQGQAGAPGDCYRVPTNGGPVTREVTYRLEFMEEGMTMPLGYAAVITEHLAGDLPNSGANSPSSSAPGWFPDQHSILAGNAVQNVRQSFTANINGVDVGLAIMGAFGGNWQQLNIEKHAGYVAINGNLGGKIDADGKLIPGGHIHHANDADRGGNRDRQPIGVHARCRPSGPVQAVRISVVI